MTGRPLSEKEFRACWAMPMDDVLATAAAPVDIGPYVDSLDRAEQGVAAFGEVRHVYRDGLARFDHVLLETDRPNVFLAVIVNLERSEILGHHMLDLNVEYGLD